MAYKLKLSDSSRVHPVFHVSQLKKAIGNYQFSPELPLDSGIDVESIVYPDKVLSWRDTFEEGQHTREW